MGKTRGNYILIVEDNSDIRELISLYLSSEDFEIITAADGYEAMQKAARYRPKIILAKGYFNNEDNFGLIETIRQTKSCSSVPVVAMLNQRNGHLTATKAGATKIIRVPEDYENLPGIV